MAEHKPLYRWSFAEAVRLNETDQWRASWHENVACRDYIDQSITRNYDGHRLGGDVAGDAIAEFGYDRVNWLLANTIRLKVHDGRFSAENKEWAKGFFFEADDIHRHDWVIDQSHPGLVDMDQLRAEQVFREQAGQIEGAGPDNARAWMYHARALAEADAGTFGAAAHYDYLRYLRAFGEAFHRIDCIYAETPAEIYNGNAFCRPDQLMPIQSAEMMFSASRSRRLSIIAVIQSYQQLEKNYGREGAAIICDNTQLTIAGGFAPGSESAERISKAMGSRTVLSGTVTKGKDNTSQQLQMTQRPLMSPDELKSMKKGSFIVLKTGTHPFVSSLKLFFQWGIRFDEANPYALADRGAREVAYADRVKIEGEIIKKFPNIVIPEPEQRPAPRPEPTRKKQQPKV